MFKVEGIGVENLRSIAQHHAISIKPITILVGKNSAGKSTFARLFPLLRQSVDSQRRSPVLWYGRIVDFGSFDDVCNRHHKSEPIKFRFVVESINKKPKNSSELWVNGSDRVNIDDKQQIEAVLSISKGADGSYASSISVKIDKLEAEINYDPVGWVKSIKCGSIEWTPNGNISAFTNTGKLIPGLTMLRSVGERELMRYELYQKPLFESLRSILKGFLHGNTQEKTITTIANRLLLGKSKAIFDSLSNEIGRRKIVHYLNPRSNPNNDVQITRLGQALLVYRLPAILELLESSISQYFSGVRYLAPLRATAQRYYREQELAVDEIDPKGENVANVISSLSIVERNDLDSWTGRHLKFTVEAIRSGGHVSLGVKQGNGEITNLADMGFGFSQVLPIPLQLWLSRRESSRNRRLIAPLKKTTCIVIEQPELHLHPDFQAKMADLFVGMVESAEEESTPPSLIIETHSSSMINRFGELVHRGVLERDKIQILLFEPTSDSSKTNIRIANFDSDGILENWPFGFFEPDYE